MSQDRGKIFPEQRQSFGKKALRYWSFRPSASAPLRIRAGFRKRLQSLTPMTGWYLQVPQEWKYSGGNWAKRKWTSAALAASKSQPSARAPKRGIYADFVPSVYDGDTLGKELASLLTGKEKILIPRAMLGNKTLVEELEKTGASVEDVPTYETDYQNCPLIDEKKEFEEGSIDMVVFTSASTVKGFVKSTNGLDYSRVRAACIGKQTKAAADAYGMQTYMSEKATIDSLIELVETLKRSEEKWN